MTMKAIRVHGNSRRGDRSLIRYEDVGKPKPKYNEILVRVVAVGANPVDWKVTIAWPKTETYGLPPFPMVLGMDFSGIIEACGSTVIQWSPGDLVFGKTDITQLGAWAEYLVINAHEVARKPEGFSHEEAASLSVAARTAWSAMFFSDGVQIEPGESLLIQGGAGGVGTFAIQLAKHRGAHVIATSSAANHDLLRQLGADEVIDYRSQRFEDVVKNVDAVLDTVGGDVMPRSFSVVRPGGRLITVVDIPSQEMAKAHGIRAAKITGTGGSPQILAELCETGAIRPFIAGVHSLSEAADVITEIEGGHVRGKLVMRVA